MNKTRVGNLLTHDVKLEEHELKTVMYFMQMGFDIELISPSNTPGNRNADFVMLGAIWEMKCPMGKSMETVRHLFRKAARQAENVIFDLRDFRGDEKRIVRMLDELFVNSHKVRRLWIITGVGVLLKKP